MRLGNSGAPRWYDTDPARFPVYLEHLRSCGADHAEVVLHDGDFDDFTARVHVVRPDWEHVLGGYLDAGIRLYLHSPLTPEFSLTNWAEGPDTLLDRFSPVLDQVAEIAEEQGGTTLVFHGAAVPDKSVEANEEITREALLHVVERLTRRAESVKLAIELRTEKESRPTAAATSRESVMRIVSGLDLPTVGICWDVAHDFENAEARGEKLMVSDQEFLAHVNHLHVHDVAEDGEPHSPLTIGRVPAVEAILERPELPIVMEVRWRMAERIGDPWDVLAESYARVRDGVADALTNQPRTRS